MGEVNYLHNSKLIKLLQTSNRKEQKRFEEYINCSFFNKNKEVIALWGLIRKRLPNFEKLPAKKELLKVLYGAEYKSIKKWSPKEDTQLRVLMNRLTNLFYDFLLYQRRETQEVRSRHLLIEELLERKLYKMIPPILKSAHKLHNKNPYRDTHYYFDDYLIHEVDFFVKTITENRDSNTQPSEVVNSFNNYSLSTLLGYYASYANRKSIVTTTKHLPAADKLIDYVEENKQMLSEIVIINYHIYMMIVEREPERHYNELKNVLNKFHNYLPFHALRNIYSFMINFCRRKMRKGEEAYRYELDKIYQESVPIKVWDTEVAFSPHHFIIHFTNMLHLKKYEEAMKFLETYQPKLMPKYVPDIPNLSYAYYYFHLKDYDTSQEYLSRVIYREDFIYTLHCKRLLIQIYYEKKEWGTIESALEALRFYLLPNRSKNIAEKPRNRYKNFLNICKKIVRQRNNAEYNQASINILQKVKKEIQETELLIERDWLLEKTEEIIVEETIA